MNRQLSAAPALAARRAFAQTPRAAGPRRPAAPAEDVTAVVEGHNLDPHGSVNSTVVRACDHLDPLNLPHDRGPAVAADGQTIAAPDAGPITAHHRVRRAVPNRQPSADARRGSIRGTAARLVVVPVRPGLMHVPVERVAFAGSGRQSLAPSRRPPRDAKVPATADCSVSTLGPPPKRQTKEPQITQKKTSPDLCHL